MALSSANNRVDFTGNGSQTVFAYTFRIEASSQLVVTKRTTAGVETTLTLTTDYTVDGIGNASGGNVTLLSALTTDYKLTIRRVLPMTQTADFRNQGEFFPEDHEDAFDERVMQNQDLQEQVTRCVRTPVSVPVSAFDPTLPIGILTAGVYLRVNSSGNGWEVVSGLTAGAMFFYPSIDSSSTTPPTGLPAGSGADGYDPALNQYFKWDGVELRWRFLC